MAGVGHRVGLQARLLRPVLVAALALAALGVPGAGPAGDGASRTTPTLQEIVQRLVREGAPGAIALVRTPTDIERAAAGRARIRPSVAMAVADRFRIASVTKTFVATVVLQLAAERRLRLSDTVERWLPGLVPNGRSITLRELLGHTSGLFDYTADPVWTRQRIARPGRVWTPRELVAVATRHPPLFRSGTDWSYSNTNYVLLGLVVEAAGRRPLGRQLGQRIFRPLRLGATSYPMGTAIPRPVAHGYLGSIPGVPIAPGRLVDITSLVSPSAWGAGQVVSNADDVSAFLAALLGGRLLDPARLAEMKTRITTVHLEQGVPVKGTADYGLGLEIVRTACGTAYGHAGDMPGYRNLVLATADGRRVVEVMVNVLSLRMTWALIRYEATQAFCAG